MRLPLIEFKEDTTGTLEHWTNNRETPVCGNLTISTSVCGCVRIQQNWMKIQLELLSTEPTSEKHQCVGICKYSYQYVDAFACNRFEWRLDWNFWALNQQARNVPVWESVNIYISMWTRLPTTDSNEDSIGTLEHHIQQAKNVSMWESWILLTIVWTRLPATYLNEDYSGTIEHHIQQAKAVSMWESVIILTTVCIRLPTTDLNEDTIVELLSITFTISTAVCGCNNCPSMGICNFLFHPLDAYMWTESESQIKLELLISVPMYVRTVSMWWTV